MSTCERKRIRFLVPAGIAFMIGLGFALVGAHPEIGRHPRPSAQWIMVAKVFIGFGWGSFAALGTILVQGLRWLLERRGAGAATAPAAALRSEAPLPDMVRRPPPQDRSKESLRLEKGRSATRAEFQDDEALYEMAFNEYSGSNRRQGLWAKAFAQSAGDVGKAQALYLEWRVKQLSAELGASLEREQEALLKQLVSCPCCSVGIPPTGVDPLSWTHHP